MKVPAILPLFLLFGAGAEDDDRPKVQGAVSEQEVDCVPKIGVGIDPKYSEECKRMTDPRLWRGLWRNEFEGSQFCAEPATVCSFNSDRAQANVWLDSSYSWPAEFKGKARLGELFKVEFIGRRTVHPGMHGHMGVFDHEIIVDRMLSMELISERSRPTKADVEAMKAQCRKTPKCSVDEVGRANSDRE